MSLNYENVGKNVVYNRSVDNIEDYVKGTIVGCYIGEDEEYYVTSIESSGECIKVYDDSLIEIIEDGGGGSVTPQGIVDATSQMTDEQAADTVANIGAEPEKFVITVTYDAVNDEYTADKTYTEIRTAYRNGKNVILAYDSYEYLISWEDGGEVVFWYLDPVYSDESPLYIAYFRVGEGNPDIWTFGETKYSPAPTTVTVSGTTPTITPAANTIYNCGELTSLTISNPPATGKYTIIFYSGATPTTTVGIENFVAEANKRYKITVEDNYATYDSWPYTPAP